MQRNRFVYWLILLAMLLGPSVIAQGDNHAGHSPDSLTGRGDGVEQLFRIPLEQYDGLTGYTIIADHKDRNLIVYCFSKGQFAFNAAILATPENLPAIVNAVTEAIEDNDEAMINMGKTIFPRTAAINLITVLHQATLEQHKSDPAKYAEIVYLKCVEDRY